MKRNRNLSKNALVRDIECKIRTTMIGALASIEKSPLAKLWGQHKMDENGEFIEPPTEEEEQWLAIWEEIRTEILDRGNKQIKNVRKEVSRYKIVEYASYTDKFGMQEIFFEGKKKKR